MNIEDKMTQAERDYIALRWKELHGEQLSPEIPTDLAAQIVSICDTLDDCTRMVDEMSAILRRAQA
jgi:hypothetical protein